MTALFWLDIETSELAAHEHRILEVACIITDEDYNEQSRYTQVTDQARAVDFNKVSPLVMEMHRANGLWMESLAKVDSESTLTMVQRHLRTLAEFAAHTHTDFAGKETLSRPTLAGSSVDFDRGFLKIHMPSLESDLHYRIFDVSSLHQFVKRHWPALAAAAPKFRKMHRALADLEDSIALARYYRDALDRRRSRERGTRPDDRRA